MAKYRPGPTIGYRGPFKNMQDIYKDYRNTLMNKGPYKAYFESRTSYGEPRKFSKTEYTREPSTTIGERVEKEQRHETTPIKTDETKTEIAKETSQKTESQIETKNESTSDKSGLPDEKIERQTDITKKRGPSPYDRVEYYGEFF